MNPNRVDFSVCDAGVVITKFWKQDGRDVPDPKGANIKPLGFNLDGAIAWLEAHGYTVRRWPNGARAWKGTPWPIRTRGQIQRKREQVEKAVMAGRLDGGFNWTSLDFALDM